MVLTDVHTHSMFSHDGKSPLADMVATAKKNRLRYFGVSDHFDADYQAQHILVHGKPVPFIDAENYFGALRRLQRELCDESFTLFAGGEFGFAPLRECHEIYGELIERYRPDFVVNSVHSLDGEDCYFAEYFAGKSQDDAYRRYLNRVRESLEAPYSYDIVAHIGYVSRNAPYANRKLRYEDFSDVLDDILKTVIIKGKILEVNSSARGAGSDFLPDTDILTRYFELGGRKVSFVSDAHDTARIADKREFVVAALKQIGFTHISLPQNLECEL